MSNKPTHFLNIVSGEGRDSQFTRVAALWLSDKGVLSGDIPSGITITGRVVILPAKSEPAEGEGAR